MASNQPAEDNPPPGGGGKKRRSFLPAPKSSRLKSPKTGESSVTFVKSPDYCKELKAEMEDCENTLLKSTQNICEKSPTPERSSPLLCEKSPAPGFELRIGDQVSIGGIKPGVLQYFGKTHFADGLWCGIALDDPDGKHDGVVDGVRYFTCTDTHGIFAPAAKVQLVSEQRNALPGRVMSKSMSSSLPLGARTNSSECLSRRERDIESPVEPASEVKRRFKSKLSRPKSYAGTPTEGSEPELKLSKLPSFSKLPSHKSGSNKNLSGGAGESGNFNSTFARDNYEVMVAGPSGDNLQNKPGNLNVTYDTESPLPDLLTPPENHPVSVLSFDSRASNHNSSLEFLQGSHLVTEESRIGILKESELNETDLLPEFLSSPILSTRGKEENQLEKTENSERQIFKPSCESTPLTICRIKKHTVEATTELPPENTLNDTYNVEITKDKQNTTFDISNPQFHKSATGMNASAPKEAECQPVKTSESNLITSVEAPGVNTTFEVNHIKTNNVVTDSYDASASVPMLIPNDDISKQSVRPKTLSDLTTPTVTIDAASDMTTEGGEAMASEDLTPADVEEGDEDDETISKKGLTEFYHDVGNKKAQPDVVTAQNSNIGGIHEAADITEVAEKVVFKEEAPLSCASPTSTDTGYQPDTDSELGTLTANSPTYWIPAVDNETVEPVKMEDAYVETYKMFQKAMDTRSRTAKLVESADSDLCSDAGTVVVDEQTDKEETNSNVDQEEDSETKEQTENQPQHEVMCASNDKTENISEENLTLVDNSFMEVIPEDSVQLNATYVHDNQDDNEILAEDDLGTVADTDTGMEINDIGDVSEENNNNGIETNAKEDKGGMKNNTTMTKDEKGGPSTGNVQRRRTLAGKLPDVKSVSSKIAEPKSRRLSTPAMSRGTKGTVTSTDESERKKPKVNVVSKIADYIKQPMAKPTSSEQDKGGKSVISKLNKNATNLKKAELEHNDKPATKSDKPRSRNSSVGKEIIRSRNNSISQLEGDATPKKVVKHTSKNKWDNIMSQLEASKTQEKIKPKTEVKSRLGISLDLTPMQSPRAKEDKPKMKITHKLPDLSKVKSKLTVETKAYASKKSGLKSETNSQNHSRSGSQMDLTDGAAEPRSQKSQIGKPAVHAVSKLNGPDRRRSTSTMSLNSEASQVSSQGSDKNANANQEPSVKASKRKSLAVINTSSVKPSEPRRTSVVAGFRSQVAPARGEKKSISKIPSGSGATQAKPTSKLHQNRNTAAKPGNKVEGFGHLKSTAHQPDLVTNSLQGPSAGQEISRLEALCEARTKELNYLKLQLKHGTLGFDALAVMVQYLTQELNAFSCPQLAIDFREAQQKLEETLNELDAAKAKTHSIEKEVTDLTTNHKKQVDTLSEEYQQKLKQLEKNLIQDKEDEVQKVINQHSHEVTTLKNYHDKHIGEVEAACKKEVADLGIKHEEALSGLKSHHAQQIEELQKQHKEKLEEITKRFENIKLSLSGKVESLKNECDDLRAQAQQYQEALERDTDYKVQMALMPYRDLPQEIESLKLVLEMKNEEIHELRRQNLEQIKQLEEIPVAREKIIGLEQKIENLEAIMNMKGDYEKQLSEKHQLLLRKFEKESKANKRLSMDNEELIFKLQFDPESPDLFRRQVSRSPPGSPGSPTVIKRGRSPMSASYSGSEWDKSPTKTSQLRRSWSHLNEKKAKRKSGSPLSEDYDSSYEKQLLSPASKCESPKWETPIVRAKCETSGTCEAESVGNCDS